MNRDTASLTRSSPMHLVQITPGTGGMYCGNCFRDNALVAALREMGHEPLMVPLYLPLTLDQPSQSRDVPIFFGGINVYLEQKFPWFRAAPSWLRHLLASPRLLTKAAGHSAKTRAEDVGEILLSMLQGADGKQARELEDLVAWLQSQPHPDVVCLSNALLLGLARPLKERLSTRLVCFLQGEDSYLDSLMPQYRETAWQLLRSKTVDVDLFIAPNHYFASVMTKRLQLEPGRVRVVSDGIQLERESKTQDAERGTQSQGAEPGMSSLSRPVIGYFARMCPEKGLGVLVDAYIDVCRRGTVPGVRLKIGGGCGATEEAYVAGLKSRLKAAGLGDRISWHPNLDHQEKLAFLRSLTVFSVPATYPEAFGLYLVEALAAGVPVVQPRFASFPEFVEATGGGVLYDPTTPEALADALENLLTHPDQVVLLGRAGQRVVHEQFSARRMAQDFCKAIASL